MSFPASTAQLFELLLYVIIKFPIGANRDFWHAKELNKLLNATKRENIETSKLKVTHLERLGLDSGNRAPTVISRIIYAFCPETILRASQLGLLDCDN